jgi:hypothetical protein
MAVDPHRSVAANDLGRQQPIGQETVPAGKNETCVLINAVSACTSRP